MTCGRLMNTEYASTTLSRGILALGLGHAMRSGAQVRRTCRHNPGSGAAKELRSPVLVGRQRQTVRSKPPDFLLRWTTGQPTSATIALCNTSLKTGHMANEGSVGLALQASARLLVVARKSANSPCDSEADSFNEALLHQASVTPCRSLSKSATPPTALDLKSIYFLKVFWFCD